jgi:hypothetical protein
MNSVLAFSSQNSLEDFANLFLVDVDGESDAERELKDKIKTVAYECCVHDQTTLMPILLSFLFVRNFTAL